jgi:hypothetical protein
MREIKKISLLEITGEVRQFDKIKNVTLLWLCVGRFLVSLRCTDLLSQFYSMGSKREFSAHKFKADVRFHFIASMVPISRIKRLIIARVT